MSSLVRGSGRLLSRLEVAYLGTLGDVVRAAPRAERARARQEAVRAAQLLRLGGVPWPLLAQAIGVSPQTLRRWRRESHDVKPPASPLILAPGRSQVSSSYEPREESLGSRSQSISEQSSQNESINAHIVSVRLEMISASPDIRCPVELIRSADADRPGRGVLALAGHAQGGFRFDQEAAAIRESMGFVATDCAPCVELSEVTGLIEHRLPRVLHVSAHACFDGLFLSDAGEPVAISWADLRKAITRAPNRPALAVFNVCRSTDAAVLLSEGVPFIVTCAGEVTDDVARRFTRAFYSRLIRRSIRNSFEDAGTTLLSHLGADGMYRLHASSNEDVMLFS